MKKNKSVKIIAFLALLGIGISVVGTGILVLTSPKETKNYQINDNNISQEELQKLIDSNKAKVKVGTGELK